MVYSPQSMYIVFLLFIFQLKLLTSPLSLYFEKEINSFLNTKNNLESI